MFRQRLFTTLILIPLVLAALFFAPPWMLWLVILALVLIGGWEWTALIPLKQIPTRVCFVMVLLGLVCLNSYIINYWLVAGLIFWLFILIAVLTFPSTKAYWNYRVIVGFACLLLLPLFAGSMAAIYQQELGKYLIVYLLCLIWAADVGAYLIGKGFGKTKLIPNVSPGKTVEGVLGGIAVAMIVSFAAYFYFAPIGWFFWFMLAGSTVLISVLGDLFISILKRRCEVKDTGHIFPGHGGVLDRLDSLIAASPVFYLGLYLYFVPYGY